MDCSLAAAVKPDGGDAAAVGVGDTVTDPCGCSRWGPVVLTQAGAEHPQHPWHHGAFGTASRDLPKSELAVVENLSYWGDLLITGFPVSPGDVPDGSPKINFAAGMGGVEFLPPSVGPLGESWSWDHQDQCGWSGDAMLWRAVNVSVSQE